MHRRGPAIDNIHFDRDRAWTLSGGRIDGGCARDGLGMGALAAPAASLTATLGDGAGHGGEHRYLRIAGRKRKLDAAFELPDPHANLHERTAGSSTTLCRASASASANKMAGWCATKLKH